MTRYLVAGGDDGCYGPRFSPLEVTEAGRAGVGLSECVVLRPDSAVQDGGTTYELLAIRPRYQGAVFEDMAKGELTVSVWLLVPGAEPSAQAVGLAEGNVRYWAIGTCKPSEA